MRDAKKIALRPKDLLPALSNNSMTVKSKPSMMIAGVAETTMTS